MGQKNSISVYYQRNKTELGMWIIAASGVAELILLVVRSC